MNDLKDIKLMIVLIAIMILGLVIFEAWHFGKIEGQLIQARNEIAFLTEQVGEMNIPKRYVYFILKITAYSSDRWQCDHDPFVGAWNNPVKDGMVAVSRDLEKIGITNKCPVIINGKDYVISDRMHWRKRNHLDIWMKTKQEAKDWGVQFKEVKVPIEYIDLDQLFKRYKIRMEI